MLIKKKDLYVKVVSLQNQLCNNFKYFLIFLLIMLNKRYT